MPIDKLLLDERFEKWEKARKPLDINDDAETVEMLKQLRPGLYYEREKYKAKWCPGDGDVAGLMRMMGKLPKIVGVQVVAR